MALDDRAGGQTEKNNAKKKNMQKLQRRIFQVLDEARRIARDRRSGTMNNNAITMTRTMQFSLQQAREPGIRGREPARRGRNGACSAAAKLHGPCDPCRRANWVRLVKSTTVTKIPARFSPAGSDTHLKTSCFTTPDVTFESTKIYDIRSFPCQPPSICSDGEAQITSFSLPAGTAR